jgi:hypothetical protein
VVCGRIRLSFHIERKRRKKRYNKIKQKENRGE